MTTYTTCSVCEGSGVTEFADHPDAPEPTCPTCFGLDLPTCPTCQGFGGPGACPACYGSGQVEESGVGKGKP